MHWLSQKGKCLFLKRMLLFKTAIEVYNTEWEKYETENEMMKLQFTHVFHLCLFLSFTAAYSCLSLQLTHFFHCS